MNNYDAIMTEARYRRQEWQRAVVAEAPVAHAFPEPGRLRWPQRSLATVRLLAAWCKSVSLPMVPGRRHMACGS